MLGRGPVSSLPVEVGPVVDGSEPEEDDESALWVEEDGVEDDEVSSGSLDSLSVDADSLVVSGTPVSSCLGPPSEAHASATMHAEGSRIDREREIGIECVEGYHGSAVKPLRLRKASTNSSRLAEPEGAGVVVQPHPSRLVSRS